MCPVIDLTVEPLSFERPGQRPFAVHLFSGPDSRPDGISATLRRVGWDALDVDKIHCESYNLLSDSTWCRLMAALRDGHIDAVILGPPCETFLRARKGPPGPRPLRSREHPYGLRCPHLSVEEFKQVTQGTYMALRPPPEYIHIKFPQRFRVFLYPI